MRVKDFELCFQLLPIGENSSPQVKCDKRTYYCNIQYCIPLINLKSPVIPFYLAIFSLRICCICAVYVKKHYKGNMLYLCRFLSRFKVKDKKGGLYKNKIYKRPESMFLILHATRRLVDETLENL